MAMAERETKNRPAIGEELQKSCQWKKEAAIRVVCQLFSSFGPMLGYLVRLGQPQV